MQPDPDSDEMLVARARAGDRVAFGRLVERHRPLLVRVCRRALGAEDGLEDVVQETALQALLGLEHLREPGSVGAWLVGIGLNVARRRRARSRERWSWEAISGGRLVTEPVSKDADPLQQIEAAEFGARVRAAVAELPPGQRAAILLVYLRGLSYAETAAALGVPVGAVKTRLHKARQRLQQRLYAVWMEDRSTMTTSSTSVSLSPVAMRVADVRRRTAAGDDPPRSVLWLEEVGGKRTLPIWTGAWEGDSIAMLLEKVQVPRPLTHALTARLLTAGGVRITQVGINRLTDETFFAQIVVASGAGEQVVDARPSDALALALETGAPIFVAPEVLEAVEAGRRARPQPAEPVVEIGAREIVSQLLEHWPGPLKPSRPT